MVAAARRRLAAVADLPRVSLSLWLALTACVLMFAILGIIGRDEVRNLLFLSVAVGVLASLTASAAFSAYLSRTSPTAQFLSRLSLTTILVAGVIVPATHMTAWRLPTSEFLTSFKISVDPRDQSIGVSEALSSRLYRPDAGATLRASDFAFADNGRLRRRILAQSVEDLTADHLAFLEASLLAALELATRPQWFRPVEFSVGPAAFSARYRTVRGAELLVTTKHLPDELKANVFIQQMKPSISLPPGTRLHRDSFPPDRGAIQLLHRVFYLAMSFESRGCLLGLDAEVETDRVLTEMVLSGKPLPTSLTLDGPNLPKRVHCTGQVWIQGGTSRLWNWTEEASRFSQWLEHVSRTLHFLLDAPRITVGDVEERRFEGLLKLKILNQLNVIEHRLHEVEALTRQRPLGAR